MRIDEYGQAVFPISACTNVLDIGLMLSCGRSKGLKSERVLFDWTGVSFASLSVITALVALQLRIGSEGYNICVSTPSGVSDVVRYISRMNYFKCIGIDREEDFVRHSEGDRFIPVTKFTSQDNRNELPDRVSRAIVAHTPLASEAKVAVNYIFGEVVDNVCEHSRSLHGGFLGAQFYPRSHRLELCIADGGCGIPQSLRRNPLLSGLDDMNVLPRALEYGIGENVDGERGSEGYGKGKGLAIISNMVCCLGGVMRILSGNASIEMDAHGIKSIPNTCFPGTVVSVELPTNLIGEVSAGDLFRGLEGSVLLDDLLDKYGIGNEYKETGQDVLW